jgi:HEAT repeat protein
MKASKFFCALLAVLALSGVAQAAPGVVLDKSQLGAAQLSYLQREIGKAKASHKTAFDQIAKAPTMAAEADELKRGPYASITRALAAVGPHAVMPIVEMLVVDGPPRGKMTDSAWTALRVSLIEALGLLRDARARGALTAILDKTSEHEVVRAAAEALGRIGDDTSAKVLATRVKRTGAKQLAILGGIGECRRSVAADALAAVVAKKPKDQAVVLGLIRALGAIGNSGAWKTAEVKKSGEGTKVRSTAAKALVQLFVTSDGHLRTKAETMILVVDDPSTPALIAAAKQGASQDLVAALDALAARFQNHPVR